MFKKIVISSLIFVFLSIIIAYFFGSKILSKSVKTSVETFGPKITQTPVRLDEVKLSVLSGNGQLGGLYVGNPEGFSSENIFALGQIEIDVETNTLMSDKIVINKIYIKEPFISYETKLLTSNLKELLKNIEESSGSSDAAETEKPETDDVVPDESAPGKDVLIKEFVIEKPNVFLGIMGIGTTVPLPSIELTDISSSEKEIAATVLKQVIAKLLNSIKDTTTNATGAATDAGKNVIDSVKNQTEEPLKQVNESIKNLLGK